MNGSTNLLISEFFVLLVIHFLVHFFIILKSQKKQTILKYGLGLVGPLLVFFHSIYALYLSIQSHVFFTKTLVLGDAEVLGSPRFVVEFHPLSALILLIFSLLMALFFWEGFRKRIELNLKNQSIGLLAMIGFTVVVYSGSLWTSVAGLGVVVLSEFLSELPSSGLSHRYASFGFVQKWIGLMLLIISGIVFENFGASLVFSAEDSWYLSPALEFASYSFLFGFGLLIGCFPFWSLFFTEKDRSFISQWIHTVIQTTSLLILFGAITPLLSRVIDLNWIHFVIFSQAVLLFLFGFFQKDPKRKMVCQSYIGLYLFYELSLNLPLNYTIPFVCISILVYSFRYFHLFYGGEILNKKNLWIKAMVLYFVLFWLSFGLFVGWDLVSHALIFSYKKYGNLSIAAVFLGLFFTLMVSELIRGFYDSKMNSSLNILILIPVTFLFLNVFWSGKIFGFLESSKETQTTLFEFLHMQRYPLPLVQLNPLNLIWIECGIFIAALVLGVWIQSDHGKKMILTNRFANTIQNPVFIRSLFTWFNHHFFSIQIKIDQLSHFKYGIIEVEKFFNRLNAVLRRKEIKVETYFVRSFVKIGSAPWLSLKRMQNGDIQWYLWMSLNFGLVLLFIFMIKVG